MHVDGAARAGPPRPGWYEDPWQVASTRWWDGHTWTGYTAGTPCGTPAAIHAPSTTAALPTARDDITGGGIALLGFFGAIAISLLFARAALSAGAGDNSLPVILAGQGGLWAGFLIAAFIVTHRRAGGGFGDLGLRMPTGNEIGLGIGIGLLGLWVASRVIFVLRALLPDDLDGVGSNLYTGSRPSMTVVLVIATLACIGAPLFEELFFRGIVQPVLTRHLGVSPAIVVQALLFGAAHFQLGMTFEYAIVRVGVVSVLGLFLGWLRAHTGRLGAGIVAHAANNVVVVGITILVFVR